MHIRAIIPGIAAAAILFMALPAPAPAQLAIGLSVAIGPPEIPVYVQPPCPVQNDIWTPGYWAYGDAGYYWVPGTWVAAPQAGYLWTPGYWGYNSGRYGWNGGYWATQVGFYGGINYGAGYYGSGYAGGNWSGNNFRYNTAVTSVNTTVIRNVYRTTVVNPGNRVAYNGGPGGITRRPTAGELAVSRAHHIAMLPAQRLNQTTAAQNRQYLAKVNNGRPEAAAVARPLSASNRPAGFQALTAADRKETSTAPKAAPKAAVVRKVAPAAAAAQAPREAQKAPAAPKAAPKAMVAPKPAQHAPAAHPQAMHAQATHPQAAHPQAARPQAAHPAPAQHPQAEQHAQPEQQHPPH